MDHVFSAEWLVGLGLGLLSIGLFANERLNRLLPDVVGTGGRERLIRMLQPALMRRSRVYFRGVLFYFGSLSAIYVLVAIFGSYLGPFIGDMAGAPGLKTTDPIWPVAIALAIVGLLPGIAPLDRIEAKARALTHRLVGVPATFNDFADRLMAVEIKPTELPTDLLDPHEAAGLQRLLERARTILGTGADYQQLEQCAIKLWCFREWLQRGGEWPGHNVRRQFEAVEEIIRPDALAVVQDLELLPAPQAVDEAERAIEHSRWRSASERALRVTDDVCALFALYTERADSMPVRRNPISDALRLLITRAQVANRRSAPVDSILLVLIVVALAAFASGLIGSMMGLLAAPDASGKDIFLASMDYVFRVAAVFGPATAIALAWSHGPDWLNGFDEGRPPTRQYLGLALMVTVITALLMGVYAFFQQLSSHMTRHAGQSDVACVIWQFLGLAPDEPGRQACLALLNSGLEGFPINPATAVPGIWFLVPMAVVAGQCAVAMALLSDAQASHRPGSRLVLGIMLLQPLIAAALMFLGGVFLDVITFAPEVVFYESLSWGLLTFVLFALTAWIGARDRSGSPPLALEPAVAHEG
jgi:hypothetical protein